MTSNNVFYHPGTDERAAACVYLITYLGEAKNEQGLQLPKYYVGSKYTSEMPTYFGSVGSKAWSKTWHDEVRTNPHLFRREIHATFDTRQKAYVFEGIVLRMFDAVNDDEFVNLSDGTNFRRIGPHSDETRAKMSESSKGKSHSTETRAKLSESKRGKPKSAETRAKMSESRTGKKRKPFSAEHRAKLSESKRGKTLSEETRAKMSGRKRKPLSEETRARMSKSKKKLITLVSPDGVLVEMKGRNEFCDVYGLNRDAISLLTSGKIDAYKGWHRSPVPEN